MLYSVKNFSRLTNASADCDMCERTCPVFCGEFSPKVDEKLFAALDSSQSNLPEGENLGDIELMPKRPELLPLSDSVGLSRSGLTLFSFCRRLQYQTRTTSFSMYRLSAKFAISSLVGFGFIMKARSSETRTLVSIDVRFLRLRPIVSGVLS